MSSSLIEDGEMRLHETERKMPGRKIRLTSGSSLIIIGTSLTNPSTSKAIKGNSIVEENALNRERQIQSILFNFHLVSDSSNTRRHHHHHHSSSKSRKKSPSPTNLQHNANGSYVDVCFDDRTRNYS